MAIRKIARMGNPILRKIARSLTPDEIKSPEIRALVNDMMDTMEDYGGIGLAAPQIHESIQLAIVGFGEENSRYPDQGNQPMTVVINPKITVLDPEKQGFWEGCLSVPELRGFVERPKKIRVEYLDLNAKTHVIELEGFVATVFQHECDHLFGKLYVDHIQDFSKFAFIEEYQKFVLPEEDGESEEEDDLDS